MRINKNNLLKDQYQNAAKLAARQAIYQYSTNKEPFWEWVAKKYPVLSGHIILEVGCGNGVFWLDALKIFPNDIDIRLTDFSQGMLDEAMDKLCHFSNIKFEVADVEHLPYDDLSCDVVLAHYMLYHVESIQRALSEIKRVMKLNSFCGILLPDNNHLQSVFSIIECENPGLANSFSAEVAYDILPNFFNKVEDYKYRDEFNVTDVNAIINYVHSLPNMDKKGEDFYNNARKKIAKAIEKDGPLKLCFNQFLFIVRK